MLIPTVLTLSEFFAKNFPDISWYPYWYLGNPFHYLIGPVVPMLLGVIRVIGEIGGVGVALEGAYLLLIFASFLLGGLGIFLLLRDFGVGKKAAILSGILYIVLPAGFFLLNYQNGLNHIALGLLPYAFLIFRRFLLKENRLLMVLMGFMISIMLLINVSSFLPLAIGLVALFISQDIKNSKEDKIVKSTLIVLLGIFLSTIWYTPKFWWVIATNPSLGGVPLGKLVWSILQFLLQFLPIALAIVIVKWRKYKPKGPMLFGLFFFTSFLFLSIIRFANDPDFVMDWIGFGLELQMGGAILFGSWFVNSSRELKTQNSKLKTTTQNSKLFIFIGFIVLSACVSLFIVKDVFVSLRSDYQERIISMLEKNVKESERVFLSGSSVFFVNSKLNIQQVRGGVDQSSIHPYWAVGSYQIREGTNSGLAYDWLRALGVSYVLVHNKGSVEPFKDFVHPEKFSYCSPPHPNPLPRGERERERVKEICLTTTFFDLIAQNHGDKLYRVNGASIGRVADASILNVQKPKNGADYHAINDYTLPFKRPLAVNYQKPNEIAISGNIKQGEIISLAISYDPYWRTETGEGIIGADSLGNMVVIPKKLGLQRFELVYKRSLLDLAIPLGLSIVIVIILVKYQKIAPYVKKRIPKLSVGLKEEEN